MNDRAVARVAVVAIAAAFCSLPVQALADSDVVSPASWRSLAMDPHVDLRLHTEHYSVRGETRRAIDASLVSSGSRATHKQNAIGMHSGGIGLRYVLLQGPATCSLYDYTVVYQGKTVLPRWTSSSGASDSTVRWWHRYSVDIEQHEQEHALIAVLEVQALAAQLDAMQATSGCEQLQADIRALVNERSRAAHERNRDFDKWTKNGTRGPYWLG